MRALLVAALIVLSGCTSDGGEEPDTSPAPGEPSPDQLSGFVIDGAIVPLEGARVTIPAFGLEAEVDANGYYGLNDVPVDEALVVIAEADGFIPTSKSITLPPGANVRLNFTLVPIPVLEPYHTVDTFDGLIACSSITRVNNQPPQRNDCTPAGASDVRQFDISLDSDVAGIVVELFWTPQSDMARDLNLTVETVGFGEFDEVLHSSEAAGPIRAQIPSSKASRFYSDGGLMTIEVDIGRNVDDDESGTGYGFAAQQDFELFVSVFYVAPPSGTYSVQS